MVMIGQALKNFFLGSPEIRKNVSTLRPEQEGLYNQSVNAGLAPGAGGAFGTAADYYRNLVSDNPEDLDAMIAPELRRYNQEIVPGLAEQFAGMGSGGLDSSGFRNAALNAGTDLSERIAALRAGIRERGAQGLLNIGQYGLNPYSQNMTTQPGTQGVLPGLGRIAGSTAGAYFGGPFGAAIANEFGSNGLSGNKSSQTSPYGSSNNINANPNNFNPGQMPTFGGR